MQPFSPFSKLFFSLFLAATTLLLVAPLHPVQGQDLTFPGQHFAVTQGGFVDPPTKGNCDPRNCHEFGNCLVDGGFGDITISPHQVAVGETLTITFTGEGSPPSWPSVLTGPPSTGGRGGRYIRWQSETLCGGPRPFPVLTRVGSCSGTSCDYELTSAGSMDEDPALGGRPWAIVRLQFNTAWGLAWDEDYFGVVGEGPTADFDYEVSEDNPLHVTFDASNSSDPEGNLIDYAWDFDGDGEDDDTTPNPVTTYTYEDEGTYNVRLTVRDSDDLEDALTKEVKVQAGRMRFVVEIDSEAEGNKTAQDDDPKEVQIGERVLVRVTVENTGILPIEDIEIEGGLEGIKVVSDPEDALQLIGARQLTIDRLEPDATGEMTVAYEAVHVAQFSVSVVKVTGTAVNPETNERTPVEEEVEPACEVGNKTGGVFQDDKKRSKGCATGEVKAGDLLVNAFASTKQAADLDPIRDGCSTGNLIMREGNPETECTLPAAIEVANARSTQGDPVTIRFDIPGSNHLIALETDLVVRGAVTIDATTQPGYSDTPAITLTAGGALIAFSLKEGATICGFEITGFGKGIEVLGAGATIAHNLIRTNEVGVDIISQGVGGGQGNTVENNTFSGNTTAGIQITGESADGNKILNNQIATGNQIGIWLKEARGTQITDNLISGSAGAGIRIEGGSSNVMQKNRIGTNEDGTGALPNRVGINIDNSSDNMIGGSRADGNTIAGNTDYSITITGTGEGLSAARNRIQGNYVGLNQQGSEALGVGFIALIDTRETAVGGEDGGNYFASIAVERGDQDFILDNHIGVNILNERLNPKNESSGVSLANTSRVRVERNVIRGKGEAIILTSNARRTAMLDNLIYDNARGIVLANAYEGNTMRRNRIYDITSLGIDYYNNYKPDGGDYRRDNRFPEPPKFYLVRAENEATRVIGQAPRGNSEQYTIDVYQSTACNNSGYGSGAAHVGMQIVDAGARFQIVTNGGTTNKFLTVTATEYNGNLPGSSDGGTTEFSKCVRLADADKIAQADFDPLATGSIMDENGVRVTVTGRAANKTTATATLYAARYIAQPDRSVFSGSATSHDGSIRTPESTMFRYYALNVGTEHAEDTLPELTYDLCLDVTGLTNGVFFERILLLHRNEATNDVWMAYDTRLVQEADGIRYVCAEGVQGFGEFGFSLGATTALGIPALVAPADETEAASENPELQWELVEGASYYEVQLARSPAFSTLLFSATDIPTTAVEAATEGPGLPHYWRVRGFAATGEAGPWSLPWSFTTQGTPVDTETDTSLPAQFVLEGNYPNPFNPQTTITYSLPQTTEVHLGVYDALGREVTVLADGMQPAGRHEVVFEAVDLPSGVYLYRLVASGQVRTGRMVLLK